MGAERLLTLLGFMERYKLGDLTFVLGSLISTSKDLATSDRLRQDLTTLKGEDYFQRLAVVLDGLSIMCGGFHPDPSLVEQIRTYGKSLQDGSADTRASVVNARLTGIIEGVQNNLQGRCFMYVPVDQSPYYDNRLLFGEQFLLSFPKQAVNEMLEVGNCYAAGRPTACVFHCMRVAEYGLRKLAKTVGVKLTDKGKPVPVEYETWTKIINAIRSKITASRQLSNGPIKQRRLEFYADMANHCEYMKDLWRTEVSHTRKQYTKPGSLDAIERTRQFIQLLLQPSLR